jgi:hypothetical protein
MKNKNDELLQAKKDLVSKILKDSGIELAVSGCGCCGSPDFTFKFNGQTIFQNEEGFIFNTDAYKDEV